MGASHGSSTDGVGSIITIDPCGGDVYTWGKDIYTGTVVGEGSTGVRRIGGTNGDGLVNQMKKGKMEC